jgi:thiamine pyrophosphokinase
MSSHHFVKEGQEPALLIANGEACPREMLDQLLEWSPYVMVLDGALPRVLDLGIKIDAVLGDFDNDLKPEELLAHQMPVEIIYVADQHKTDLEKGIEALFAKNFAAINIVWATGLRADHSFSNIASLAKYKGQGDIVMFDEYSRICLLKPSFEKWYVKGTIISLIPVGVADGVWTSGLKYNLDNEQLMLGERHGNSNETIADGFVKITHTNGSLLLMECHD